MERKGVKYFHIQHGRGRLNVGFGAVIRTPAGIPVDAVLIHVIHEWCGPEIKSKRLYGGVDGQIIGRLPGGTLLQLRKGLPGDKITVFAYSGMVQVIEFVGDDPQVSILAPQDALQARLDSIGGDLYRLEDLDPEDVVRKKFEDKLLHQVADLLEKAGNDSFMRKQVFAFTERTMSKMAVRGGVRKHFKEVLESLGDTAVYGWLFGKIEETSGLSNVVPLFPRDAKKEKPSLAKIKADAQKRRDDRNAKRPPKGKSEEKPLHQGAPKKKEGGKKK